MSTPMLALALAAMCALFSAAAADTAQVMGLRNEAANEARRVAVATLDGCAVGSGARRQCRPPTGCAFPRCSVCWRNEAVRADIALDWAPAVLRGLTPARGRHALTLGALNVRELAGTTLPACAE